VDTTDPRAVSAFDRKRKGRTTSNAEWQNPHEPDAKIGPDKKGVTRMLYKPEHVVDLETGAIVDGCARTGGATELGDLQAVKIRTAIADPVRNRRWEKLSEGERRALLTAQRTTRSARGRALMRRRGEICERSFVHVLDYGGARRTTLQATSRVNSYLIRTT
jgi:transposase